MYAALLVCLEDQSTSCLYWTSIHSNNVQKQYIPADEKEKSKEKDGSYKFSSMSQ